MPDIKIPERKPRSSILYLIIIALIIAAVFFVINPTSGNGSTKIPLNVFVQQVQSGTVESVKIIKNKLDITLVDSTKETVYKDQNEDVYGMLEKAGVSKEKIAALNIEVVPTESSDFWLNLLISAIPFLLIIGFFVFMMRSAQSANNQALSFGKSKARLVEGEKQKTTFEDVAGAREAKEELMEIVDFLKMPGKYTSLGAKIPKGVLLIGPPGCGKCVTGDTMILTNKGPLKIKDVPKYFSVDSKNKVFGARVGSISPNPFSAVQSKATHWYDLKEAKILNIKTRLGYSISGTYEHPILAVSNDGDLVFKRLDQLKLGDFACTKYNNQLFGNQDSISKDTAYILGLFTGDGCATIKDRIAFSTKDREFLNFVKKYFKKQYNYKLRKASGKYDYEICRRDIVRYLREQGLLALYAKDKEIPDSILLSSKPIVVSFLQGLFDTDGYVEVKRGCVLFSSSSEKMVKQIGTILLNLGIVNHYYTRPIIKYNHLQYYIEISGDFLLNFEKEAGFRLKRKKEALKKCLSKTRNTNVNIVPNQHFNIKRIWQFLVQSGSKPSLKITSTFHKNILRYINQNRRPSVFALKKFVDICHRINPRVNELEEYKHLKLLANSQIFFSPVVAINKGRDRVYDFTVKNIHNFLANGFVSHNTLLARAVAGEANVPFFNISGSEFVEMFVGVGASRVRDLFKRAKRNAPCIVFIDEIDAVGRHRGAGMGGGHDEREQTLNQILTEMDGFEQGTNVIVMSATNRPDILDPALLRPGRFDRRITVDAPDIKEREEILQIYARNKPLDSNVELGKIAKTTPGFTGADLENLMNEAAILAARKNSKIVTMHEIEMATEKVIMGPERKSRILSKHEKSITAHHEVGHAVTAHALPNCDPVHKISIVSRGMALGVTWFMPEEDKHLYSKRKFESELTSLMGGYATEQMIFGDITTGASNDLERATNVARRMVTEYGMSDLGPITFGEPNKEIFLGRDFGHMRNYSEEIASKIDGEVKKIVEKAYETAKTIVAENKDLIKKIAKNLINKETITREEFLTYFGEHAHEARSKADAKKTHAHHAKKSAPHAHTPAAKKSPVKIKRHAVPPWRTQAL
ncbi:ATP-dependent metallopeptidase FtsH/Yme1/Tma family protein [Candidatus Peregrinibacteria bacterium]|nr:ATP-dependent metallopeptidase FtsH/Yme1/Tma family protein [Candidatus Peregrinibacteria bacterium]